MPTAPPACPPPAAPTLPRELAHARWLGCDAHLPPIAAAQLTPEALRRSFALRAQRGTPLATHTDHATPTSPSNTPRDAPAPRPAAVLLPIITHTSGATVLLTQRTAHLSAHASEIALPGGRCDPQDPGPQATALREAWEETALPPQATHILGPLPTFLTGTGYCIHPIAALVTPGQSLHPQPGEVAEIFEVPLAHILTPAHHHRFSAHWRGRERTWLTMPSPDTQGHPRPIWGATAAILRSLYDHLREYASG